MTLGVLPAFAQYSIRRNGEVIQLVEAATQTNVSVLPSVGEVWRLALPMRIIQFGKELCF